MQRLLPLLLFCLVCVSAARAQTPAATPQAVHTWKTIDGRSFQATLLKIRDPLIELRLPDGKAVTFPIARLSPEDQSFLKPSAAPATPPPPPTAATPPPQPKAPPPATPPPASPSTTATRLPPEKRTWPPLVEVDSRAIEV